MKTYFVFSDVHGFYDELLNALKEASFDINNPEHIIISCGDLCDRGSQAKEVLEFVNSLYDKDRAILIRGNHEDLMEEAISRHYFEMHDISNRTHDTAYQLTGLYPDVEPDEAECLKAMKKNELWNKYIDRCVDYYEIGDYIFVHGWIPCSCQYIEDEEFSKLPLYYRPYKLVYTPDWRNNLLWEEARWYNGMLMWAKGIREPGKTIVCGHWRTSWGHCNLHNDGVEKLSRIETFYIDPETGRQEPHVNNDIFYDEGIIALDTTTVSTRRVNIFTFTEG